MSQLSKDSKAKVIELLKSSLKLYQQKRFRDCLKKYEAILSIINPNTDNNIVKAVLFALISQVYFKIIENETTGIVENETTGTNTSENNNLFSLTIPTNQLLRNRASFSNEIEDAEFGAPNVMFNSGAVIFNSGQIEDPPIGAIQSLIGILDN